MSAKQRGKTQTKSVEVMLNNFHADFQSGLDIVQIAEKYNVGKSYVYQLLEKIAEQNGVKRDFYLKREHLPHNILVEYDRNTAFTHYTEEMFQSSMKSFDDAVDNISEIISNIEAFKQEVDNSDEEENQL